MWRLCDSRNQEAMKFELYMSEFVSVVFYSSLLCCCCFLGIVCLVKPYTDSHAMPQTHSARVPTCQFHSWRAFACWMARMATPDPAGRAVQQGRWGLSFRRIATPPVEEIPSCQLPIGGRFRVCIDSRSTCPFAHGS